MKCRSRQKNHLKDPNEPAKPPKPYIRYSRSVWEKISSDNPGLNIGQIGNVIGRMWRNLPDDDKEIFNQEHRDDLIKYENEMRLYYKSSDYLNWLKKVNENTNSKKENSKKSSNQLEKNILDKENFSDENYIQAEPDSDEEVLYIDYKTESANRFYRNHSLMLELFSDTRVPIKAKDLETIQKKDIEAQVKEIRSQLELMDRIHIDRVMKLNESNQNFDLLMQKENENLHNILNIVPGK